MKRSYKYLNSRQLVLLLLIVFFISACKNKVDKESYFVVAYISGGEGKPLPNFDLFTHLNYAFGKVNSTFNGVEIENIERFSQIAKLKIDYNAKKGKEEKNYVDRKMLLSIGGWSSGGFSEMVSDSLKRALFVRDCKKIVENYQIDGIDLDWEYPSSGVANISSASSDIENFTKLVKELRSALGEEKLLTIATIASARFIDFALVDEHIDFYNIMSYDMAVAPYHHSPLHRFDLSLDSLVSITRGLLENKEIYEGLFYPDSAISQEYNLIYRSPIFNALSLQNTTLLEGLDKNFANMKHAITAGQITADEAVALHIIQGLPKNKLNLGIPFYGKGSRENWETAQWDSIAKVPYMADEKGVLQFGFEDEKSIKYKCDFIKKESLLGGMYWEYSIDTLFVKIVANNLLIPHTYR